MKDAVKIEASSGNVFEDLGFARPGEALAKAELARQIARIGRERGLKQAQVAKGLGVDQAKVSALSRGVLAGFSTERLFRFLTLLDQDIEIVIRKKRRPGRRGVVTVVAAG